MFRTYHQENNPIMAYDSSDSDRDSYYDYDKDNYEDISDDDDWMEEDTGGGSAKDKVKVKDELYFNYESENFQEEK